MSKFVIAVASISVAALCNIPCFAQSADGAVYRKFYEAALELHKEARSYQNGWTVTTAALHSAKAAADKHDFNSAAMFARQAEALARESVEQSKNQKKVWESAVVK